MQNSDLIKNFDYRIDDLAMLLVDAPFYRGRFISDLAINFREQSIDLKKNGIDSYFNIFHASNNLFLAGNLFLIKDSYSAFTLDRHEDLIRTVGSMPFNEVSSFLGSCTTYLIKKDFFDGSILNYLTTSKTFFDKAWSDFKK